MQHLTEITTKKGVFESQQLKKKEVMKDLDGFTKVDEAPCLDSTILEEEAKELVDIMQSKAKIEVLPTTDWNEPTMSKEKLKKIKEQAEAENLIWQDAEKKNFVLSNNPSNLWNVDANAGLEWNTIINKGDLSNDDIANWHRKWVKNFPPEELEAMIPIICKRTFAKIKQVREEKKQTAVAMLTLVKQRIDLIGAKPLNQKEEAQTYDEIMKRPMESIHLAIKFLLQDIKHINASMEEIKKKRETGDIELIMEADHMLKMLRYRFASLDKK